MCSHGQSSHRGQLENNIEHLKSICLKAVGISRKRAKNYQAIIQERTEAQGEEYSL